MITSCTKEPLREFPCDTQGRCGCDKCQQCFAMARQMRKSHESMLLRIYNDVYGTTYTYEEVYGQ